MDNIALQYDNNTKNKETILNMVDDILFRKSRNNLSSFDVVPFNQKLKITKKNVNEYIRIFKINEIVYSKDEAILDKLTSLLNSVANKNCSVFVIMDSDGKKTDFYMGVRVHDENTVIGSEVFPVLHNSLKGQFPGTKTQILSNDNVYELINAISNNTQSISTVSCVANKKNSTSVKNEEFVQGLEKFAISMQDETYTGIILAKTTTNKEIEYYNDVYCQIATQLSSYSQVQQSISFAKTKGQESSLSIADGMKVKTKEKNKNISWNINLLIASINENYPTISKGMNTSESRTESETFTIQDKAITNILEKIDKELNRISEFESQGMWECASYFVSKERTTSERAAATYLALMRGENTGIETSAINTWRKQLNCIESEEINTNFENLTDYVSNFIHPTFYYNNNQMLLATCQVSGKELALHMGLPRKSIPGLPIIEHAEFAKEVTKYDSYSSNDFENQITLGKIFNMGEVQDKYSVNLNINDLAMHTFITGSTGSGKSNTVYNLLDKLSRNHVNFMVIEPAKGEYKTIFGKKNNVTVFGTNKKVFSNLLTINPFKFPTNSVHVYEHIDRLIEIFNVCWPMYAAMPAVLKEAIIKTYEKCGWNMDESTNKYDLFPTFSDLLAEITNVIKHSDYSDEVKGNYIGSLVTRVKSLTNGINGTLFNSDEVDNKLLFDSNVIVDISRIGSSETKALIMGILVMRLNEYRADNSLETNSSLKHVTVLEEAHNILKRTSTEQNPDIPNVAGKSVEMISNAIAEMRTYGEGFIIADQSPTSIDISAIKNTNTKIIMRLPEEADRQIVGKSAALNNEQINEISKLPLGVAVIYQNNWVEPVLCNIDYFKDEYTNQNKETAFVEKSTTDIREFKTELIKMALSYKNIEKFPFDFDYIKTNIKKVYLPSHIKLITYKLIENETDRPSKSFKDICDIVCEIVSNGENFDELIGSSTERLINNYLHKLISSTVTDESLFLDISQCFMYKYAFENPSGKKKYDNWRELILKGVI